MTGVPTGEVIELLQGLIRNACVNDGTPESGQEVRNAELLADYFAGSPLGIETFEPVPGRRSLVARLEGSDPEAPTLCLMGHTDVVPATPERWRRDPFGGDLVDGEVWGRGAVDMLNLTASMAVATRHLAARRERLPGTLLYFAVADEEAGGALGAGWVTENAWESVRCDYLLTEMGGVPVRGRDGLRVWLVVGEKGVAWRRLRVRGTPGHGSLPFGTDNAVVRAAEVVRRLAEYGPPPRLDDLFRQRVETLDIGPSLRQALLDPAQLASGLEALGGEEARQLHALSHTTLSPNVIRGGVKTNVIPDEVVLEVDMRLLPGEEEEAGERHLRAALGELYDEVEVSVITGQPATESAVSTPLWRALERQIASRYPGAPLLPALISAGTDARYFRLRGTVCYGAGLYADTLSLDEFWTRFHGDDERIDTRSLELTTGLWLDVVPDVLGG